ncbi:MAG: hypothetical protein RL226_506 [Bacteroidota bacterium]|jgi:hypothetical protein
MRSNVFATWFLLLVIGGCQSAPEILREDIRLLNHNEYVVLSLKSLDFAVSENVVQADSNVFMSIALPADLPSSGGALCNEGGNMRIKESSENTKECVCMQTYVQKGVAVSNTDPYMLRNILFASRGKGDIEVVISKKDLSSQTTAEDLVQMGYTEAIGFKTNRPNTTWYRYAATIFGGGDGRVENHEGACLVFTSR